VFWWDPHLTKCLQSIVHLRKLFGKLGLFFFSSKKQILNIYAYFVKTTNNYRANFLHIKGWEKYNSTLQSLTTFSNTYGRVSYLTSTTSLNCRKRKRKRKLIFASHKYKNSMIEKFKSYQ
jgi:hypothetical protein